MNPTINPKKMQTINIFFITTFVLVAIFLSMWIFKAFPGENIIEVERSSPIMDRIMFCESSSRHLGGDGQVIIHVNNNKTYDIGLFQINSIWNETATDLGLNLFLEEDNKTFAYWLYSNKGTDPWSSSQKCWNK